MGGCVYTYVRVNTSIYTCMSVYISVKSVKRDVAHLPSFGVSFEAGTDFNDFLVRQSIVPSAMLVMANRMATTRNAIARIA